MVTGIGIGNIFPELKKERKSFISFDYNSSTRTTFRIELFGSKTIRIDWGDGVQNVYNLSGVISLISHTYTGASANKTIIIYNAENITGLTTGWTATASEQYRYTINLNEFINLNTIDGRSTKTTLTGNIGSLYKLTSISDVGLGTIYANLVFLDRIIYLKCRLSVTAGDIADLKSIEYIVLSNNTNITGDISNLLHLKTIAIYGTNTLFGSISNLTNLEYLEVLGNRNLTGSFTNLTKIQFVNSSGTRDTFSGDLTGKTSLSYFLYEGPGTVTGDISTLSALTYCRFTGNNTIYGASLPNNIQYLEAYGLNNINISGVLNCPKLSMLTNTRQIYTSIQVNQILSDFWTNRAINKVLAFRTINLTGGVGSASPTGQGLIDKANLSAYQSPPGTTYWTVVTR